MSSLFKDYGFYPSGSFKTADLPDLTGYVVFITGANSGIGLETTLALAMKGARVYMACRNKEKAAKAMEWLKEQCASEGVVADVRFLYIDLTRMETVKICVEEFLRKESQLHILINNAGAIFLPYYLTKDDFEVQWQVIYMGHFYLTYLLLPTIENTAQKSDDGRVRIVNTSSCFHYLAPRGIQFDDFNMPTSFTLTRYAHAKLATVLHARELSRRYAPVGITAYSVHPGYVATSLFDDYRTWNIITQFFVWLGAILIALTCKDGANTSVYAAAGAPGKKKGELSGEHFVPGPMLVKGSKVSRDPAIAERLWEESVQELQARELL